MSGSTDSSGPPSSDFNKAICNLWDMHNAEINRLRLEYLNRVAHVEADYAHLKSEMTSAATAARTTEQELRLRVEAAEKRTSSAERKAERLERKITELKLENEKLRAQGMTADPSETSMPPTVEGLLTQISRLQEDMGNLKKGHGEEVARLRSNFDRQREQYLRQQEHLDAKAAEWTEFRQKVVARSVSKRMESVEKKENEARSPTAETARNSKDASPVMSSGSTTYRRKKSDEMDEAVPATNIFHTGEGSKSRPTSRKGSSDHEHPKPVSDAMRGRVQEEDPNATGIHIDDVIMLTETARLMKVVTGHEAQIEPRKKPIFMASSILESPPPLPPVLAQSQLVPPTLSLDQEEISVQPPAITSEELQEMDLEGFVPETPFIRDRTSRDHPPVVDSVRSNRTASTTKAANPAPVERIRGEDGGGRRTPSPSPLQHKGKDGKSSRAGSGRSSSEGLVFTKPTNPATNDAPLKDDVELLGSDESVVIVHGASSASPSDLQASDRRSINGPVASGSGSKKDDVGYKYQEVVRNRDERRKMHGEDCACCNEFYAAAGPVKPLPELGAPAVDESDHVQLVSRHRYWSKNPSTPPGFWQVDFPSTQEAAELNKQAKAGKKQGVADKSKERRKL
ncbi:hypothetical protein HDV00_011084 [Rhizophlyctis rosea]|nr:hypothetical protein HDV00_011084 [Rhizophlyctis rosea]